MLAFLPPFLMQVFQIPARFVLGMYLLIDNLLPFLSSGEGGVAHGAHIGGFVIGGRRRVAHGPADDRGPSHGDRGRRERPAGRRVRFARRSRRAAPRPPLAPTSTCPHPRPGDSSRPTRPWSSPAGCARPATPRPRSPSCGRRRGTCREGRASRGSRRSPGRSCSRTWGSPRPPTRTCSPPSRWGRSPRRRPEARRGLAAIEALQKRRIGRLHSTL